MDNRPLCDNMLHSAAKCLVVDITVATTTPDNGPQDPPRARGWAISSPCGALPAPALARGARGRQEPPEGTLRGYANSRRADRSSVSSRRASTTDHPQQPQHPGAPPKAQGRLAGALVIELRCALLASDALASE